MKRDGPRTASFFVSKNQGISLICQMVDSSHMYITYICIYIIYTSSTAQGGGGSFKNRKPIGEIGCCESGMAERSH